jgi:hypothetical protein
MAKKRKQTRAGVGSLTPEQQRQFELRLGLQQRALEMAEAQADREQQNYVTRIAEQRANQQAQEQQARENQERQAQFDALNQVAGIYSGQAADYGKQFDDYGGQVEGQRQAALAQLAEAYGRGQTGISDAERQLMESLVAGQSYSDVPLVELGQIANPLLGGLAAEGASSAGVQQQSAQDAQMAAQLAAMTRGSMGQLNTGEANYLNALRNSGAFSAAQARQGLSSNQAMVGQGIRSQYDQLAQQIAQQRLEAVSNAERQAAESRAQAQGYAPIVSPAPMPVVPEPEFDYAASLEKARQAALAQIRGALPKAGNVGKGGKKGGKAGKTGNKNNRPVDTDPFSGTSTITNQYL